MHLTVSTSMREKELDRSADQSISRWISMVVYFHRSFPGLLNALTRPRPFCPMIERSMHMCGIVDKFWDCCENDNMKRNRTKPKNKHCILVRTNERELKDFPGVNTPLDLQASHSLCHKEVWQAQECAHDDVESLLMSPKCHNLHCNSLTEQIKSN